MSYKILMHCWLTSWPLVNTCLVKIILHCFQHRGAYGLAGQFVPRLVRTVSRKGPEHVPGQPLKMVDSLAQDPARRLQYVTLNLAQVLIAVRLRAIY